jgi:hypothetical protein
VAVAGPGHRPDGLWNPTRAGLRVRLHGLGSPGGGATGSKGKGNPGDTAAERVAPEEESVADEGGIAQSPRSHQLSAANLLHLGPLQAHRAKAQVVSLKPPFR